MPEYTNSLRIRRGDLVGFYISKATDHPSTPTKPSGLSILSGIIAQNALKERLAKEQIPTSISQYTTIEDLAQNIVETSRRTKVTVLSQSKRKRSIRAIIEDPQDKLARISPELDNVAARLPWESSGVLDQFDAEYVEWARATAAGLDQSDLKDIIGRVRGENSHAAEKSNEYISAFRQLDLLLLQTIDNETYITRNHLVRDAATKLHDIWTDCYPDIEWVSFSTISVLDNPTMRLLTNLVTLEEGPEIHMFTGAGTHSTFRSRLEAAGPSFDFTIKKELEDTVPNLPTAVGKALLAGAEAYVKKEFSRNDIQLFEVPDSRREVEHTFHDINKKLTNGADPQDLLVIGREALPYQPYVDDVARLYNIPYHVEAREKTQYRAAYTLLESIFELFATPTNEELGYLEFLQPVRAGLSLAGPHDPWPIPDDIIRETKRIISARHPNLPSTATITDWIINFRNTPAIDKRMVDYVEWVHANRTLVPTANDLRDLITDTSNNYIEDTLPGTSGETFGGVAVNPTRIRSTEKSPEYFAKRTRDRAAAVAEHFEWAIHTLSTANPGWEEALDAFLGVVGESDFGLPNQDADAIRIIDAGNSFYRDAKTVYIMGLASGTFPTTSGDHTFIHPDVRTAARTYQEDYPFIYLDNDRAQFERDLDMYEAALRTAKETIILTRPYKDSDNRDIAASPFLDACDFEEVTRRISMDEYLPTPDHENGETWTDVWPTLSKKDRIRSLMLYSGDIIAGPDAPDQEDLQELARYLSSTDGASKISERSEQFKNFVERFTAK